MNKKQKAAATRLLKALDACHRAGLTGGVYDCGFYVWPANCASDPRDSRFRFFDVVREIGGDYLVTKMKLDGGSGA